MDITRTDGTTPARFTAATLDSYLAAGAPTVTRVSHRPEVDLAVDPHERRLSLECDATKARPDLAVYDHLSLDVVSDNGIDKFLLSADAHDAPFEAYSFLMSVVERLVAGESFKVAVEMALGDYRELLSKLRKLTLEAQIGLFGELGFLSHLVDAIGPEDAIAAWVGPLSEEHDFVLTDIDVEVKSTLGEKRVHRISGLSQLATTGGRPLYLLSVQVTRAGGADDGETLPERVGRVRSELGDHAVRLDEALRGLGWDSMRAVDLYTERWMHRSAPRAYLVDTSFPAVTPAMLEGVVPHLELVSGVAYSVDVGALNPVSSAPVTLAGFCDNE